MFANRPTMRDFVEMEDGAPVLNEVSFQLQNCETKLMQTRKKSLNLQRIKSVCHFALMCRAWLEHYMWRTGHFTCRRHWQYNSNLDASYGLLKHVPMILMFRILHFMQLLMMHRVFHSPVFTASWMRKTVNVMKCTSYLKLLKNVVCFIIVTFYISHVFTVQEIFNAFSNAAMQNPDPEEGACCRMT